MEEVNNQAEAFRDAAQDIIAESKRLIEESKRVIEEGRIVARRSVERAEKAH